MLQAAVVNAVHTSGSLDGVSLDPPVAEACKLNRSCPNAKRKTENVTFGNYVTTVTISILVHKLNMN